MWEVAACAMANSIASIRPRPREHYVDPAAPTYGTCKGCGAPWQVLPVNTGDVPLLRIIDSYNRCSYCKRPFRT